jgi:hypothetical protein
MTRVLAEAVALIEAAATALREKAVAGALSCLDG